MNREFFITPYGRGFGRSPLFEELLKTAFDEDAKIFKKDIFMGATLRSDIQETDNSYIVDIEIPGFNKEDLTIEVEDDVLTISAETKKETEETEKNYVRKERYSGKFVRSFRFENVDADAVTAKYDKGILTVELPKLQKSASKKGIKID